MPYKQRKSTSYRPNSVEAELHEVAAIAQRPVVDLTAPKELSPKQRELWGAVIETRPATDWPRADLVLLKAYVRAWTDIEKLNDELDREGMTVSYGHSGKPIANPKLHAMSQRIAHMSLLFLRLGMQLKLPMANPAAVAGMKVSKERQAALHNVMQQDAADEDGLLAGLQ